MRAVLGDVDPLTHAGEGISDTDEIARPEDVSDPFLRNEVIEPGYYPGPDTKRKMKKY